MRNRILLWYIKRNSHWEFDFDDGSFRFVKNNNHEKYFSFGFNGSKSKCMFKDIGLAVLEFIFAADARKIFLTHELK